MDTHTAHGTVFKYFCESFIGDCGSSEELYFLSLLLFHFYYCKDVKCLEYVSVCSFIRASLHASSNA